MADQLQLRGGTTNEHSTFTGALREVTVDTDKDTLIVHDAATAGGHPLAKENLSNVSAATAATKLDGQTVKFGLGAAATPSVTFNGDLNTGVYSPGAYQVAVATNGVGRLFVDASGKISNNTLGGNSPAELNIVGKIAAGGPSYGANPTLFGDYNFITDAAADTRYLAWMQRRSSNARAWIGSIGGGNFTASLIFGTNDTLADVPATERMRITALGRVGIGTSSPSSLLEVDRTFKVKAVNTTTIASERGLTVYNNQSNGLLDTTLVYGGAATSYFAIGHHNGTSYSERLRITSAGLVGIGTTSPSYLLHLAASEPVLNIASSSTTGDGAQIRFVQNNGRVGRLYLTAEGGPGAGAMTLESPDGRDIIFKHISNERARIDSIGRLGIGTSLPGAILHTSQNSSGSSVIGAAIRNNSDAAFTGVILDLSPSTNSPGARSAQIEATNNGSNAINLAFKTSNGALPATHMTLDYIGRLGIGTSAPANTLHVIGTGRFNVSGANNAVLASDGGDPFFYTEQAAGLKLGTNSAVRMTINSSGNVGIGTTSPYRNAHFHSSTTEVALKLTNSTSGSGSGDGTDIKYEGLNLTINNREAGAITFETSNSPAATIDSSGRLLVGTSSASASFSTLLQTASSDSFGILGLAANTATPADNSPLGDIRWSDSGHTIAAMLRCKRDGGTWSASSNPTRLEFYTTADGASSPTERMRITSGGNVLINKTSTSQSVVGMQFLAAGPAEITTDGNRGLLINRKTSDGQLVAFDQDGTTEGSISVSGTTVSYNGAHLSRWSQILGIDPYDKVVRPEILRGTVMSNLDEMCDWTCPTSGDCQDNEQLNKTKISDVEGDKNVAGIFQGWDDDDDTWVNDYYLAMTGDFVIRIAAGTTVNRGDLLMSAGDGTAKPQGDDIIRSKTIAKVTSTHVSETYADGSYCVPCVLMAC